MAVLGAMAMAGFTLPATAAGNTFYVDQAAGADSSECGEAPGAEACATIGAALAQVTPDDVVSIAAGPYTESLAITTPVTLQGAAGVVLTGSEEGEPVVHVSTDSAVTITDMTIHPGPWDGTGIGNVVRVEQGGAADLTRVAISGEGEDGLANIGVLALPGSTVDLAESTISGVAHAVMAGGELGEASTGPATVTMTTSALTGNSNGIAMLAGDLTVTDSSMSDNMAAGVMAYGPEVLIEITGTTISDNGTDGAGDSQGGVVLQRGGTFTGERLTMAGNSYGVAAHGGGEVTLTDSSIVDGIIGVLGRADESGGEVSLLDLTMSGSEMSGHTLGMGLDGVRAQISTSTVTANSGGIVTWATAGSRGSLELTDSVVSGNGDGNGPESEIGPAGVSIEGPTDVVITDTELDHNGVGLFVNPDSTLSMTGGTISDNDWIGLFLAEQPNSGTEITADLTGTSINGNGFNPPTGAIFGFGGIGTRFHAAVTGTDLTIADNAAGVLLQGGSLTLTDSAVRDTVTTPLDDVLGVPITGHGILVGSAGPEWVGEVELVRTEVSGNARTGLLLGPDNEGRIVASTIAGNGGAGILREWFGEEPSESDERPFLLAGSTVAQNGEGALVLGESGAATVIGSILQAAEGTDVCTGNPALTDGGYNVVSDETCALSAASTVVGDPQLEPLGANGGPTNTALPGPASPAVNLVPTGTSVLWGESTIDLCPGETDQRGGGYPRLVGDACDAGAVERAGGLITVTAGDATWYEGAFEPEIAAGYEGFIGEDTVADLDTPPTCDYDVETATTYCFGGADDFYAFDYVDGTLTVLDPLVIVTDTLPGATVGEEYSVTLEATGGDGGPYTWGVFEGELPAGLTIDTETGEISGIPEAAGEVTSTVFVGDPITKQFTITVEAAAVEPTDPPTTVEPTDPPSTVEPTDPPSDGAPTDVGPTDQPTEAAPVSPTGGTGGTGGSGQGLPDTGSDGLTALALSAAVALLGSAVLLVARRHRRLPTGQ
ncbi:right-handed parallel beta-helix repeat-containing protein [Pseudactinotalea suaedae]|uniref:right-handed parallel beta-helix repeat-containing protein n=1 Tax=Pseudactinotalea suaedae TaxID=1524924 RepID=UPI001391B0E0|nr:right-handed parallel beta-helix repeat-containing protein [Pseudactinotalea suaedae]